MAEWMGQAIAIESEQSAGHPRTTLACYTAGCCLHTSVGYLHSDHSSFGVTDGAETKKVEFRVELLETQPRSREKERERERERERNNGCCGDIEIINLPRNAFRLCPAALQGPGSVR